MNPLDRVTLKAFLAALMQLDNELPGDLQNQLNEVGRGFPSDVSKLHALAKSYSPLANKYMDARLALQQDGERLRFTRARLDDSIDSSDEFVHFAVEVLKAKDSVDLARKQVQEASGFELLQLQHQIAPLDQIKERLSQLLAIGDAVDDAIPPEELEESEAAWQDYKDGHDPGLSLEELKLKLFGGKA